MSNDVMGRLEAELAEAKAHLRDADGLWEYWRSHDITRTDDEWSAFSFAVACHLERKPVPARFLSRAPGLGRRAASANQVRENIRAYLQHVADTEVGTVLSPASRAIVGFCAEWVNNRLDEKWLADKVVPLAGPVELSEPEEPSV